MTKFFKNVQFLEPYFNSAKNLVPIEKVKYIKGYSVINGLIERGYGAILRNRDNKTFNITLKIKQSNGQNEYLIVVLDTLAHELAHLVHWEHTAEHLELQTQILNRFSKVAKQLGVQDTYMRINKE